MAPKAKPDKARVAAKTKERDHQAACALAVLLHTPKMRC
jgi:hypothetical protein